MIAGIGYFKLYVKGCAGANYFKHLKLASLAAGGAGSAGAAGCGLFCFGTYNLFGIRAEGAFKSTENFYARRKGFFVVGFVHSCPLKKNCLKSIEFLAVNNKANLIFFISS